MGHVALIGFVIVIMIVIIMIIPTNTNNDNDCTYFEYKLKFAALNQAYNEDKY